MPKADPRNRPQTNEDSVCEKAKLLYSVSCGNDRRYSSHSYSLLKIHIRFYFIIL